VFLRSRTAATARSQPPLTDCRPQPLRWIPWASLPLQQPLHR